MASFGVQAYICKRVVLFSIGNTAILIFPSIIASSKTGLSLKSRIN
jgi:hypothetical protein